MGGTNRDIVIIGGGIIGCAIAESLAGRGLSVTLLERGHIGHEASWAAAGMLAPQSEMSEPGPYMDFCLESRRMYASVAQRIRAETAIDPQYRTEGMLYPAFSEREEATITGRARWQSAAGLGVEVLSADRAREAEPRLSDRIRMAVHFREDHQLDPRLMTRGYMIAARQKGADLREYAPVLGVMKKNDRVTGVTLPGEEIFCDRVIVAAGSWSGLLEGLGVTIPTYPVKGEVALLQGPAGLFSHILHSERVYLAPRLDGRVVVGATEFHDAGYDKSVRAGSLHTLMENAFELLPALGAAELVDSWAGLRPGTPDRKPVLGESGVEGLILATGHFRNGVLLAPVTAEVITELVTEGRMREDAAAWNVARFGREESHARGVAG